MKIAEIICERDVDQALRSGLEQGQIGWAVRDVRPGMMNSIAGPKDWRKWSEIVRNQQWQIVDMPIRWLIASQKSINPDFQNPISTYQDDDYQYPLVVKKSGKLVIMDGHHRVGKAAHRGDQVIRVRYINLDDPLPEMPRMF